MSFRWVLFFFAAVAPLAAHPHVWATTRAELTVDNGFVDGVWAVWSFDEAFSQLVLADNDNGDGVLTAAESASVKKTYFDNLKNFGYFTHLVLGGKTLPFGDPTQFQATVSSGKVVYRFFLPLAIRVDARTTLAVSFYDESFFTDMVFEKSNLVVTARGGKATVTLKKDPTRTFYGGQVTPTFAVLSWSAP